MGVVCTGVEVMGMGNLLISFPFNAATPLFLVWECIYCKHGLLGACAYKCILCA